MEQDPKKKHMLFFCEDCGEKNFLSINQEEKSGQDIKFRCHDCDYLNTVTVPTHPPKDS